MELIGKGRARLLGALSVLFAVVVGAWLRYELWLRWAGLEKDYVPWAITHYFGGVAGSYVAMAQRILAGNWRGLGMSYPPGYPAFLAAVQWLAPISLQQTRLLQAGIDAGAAALVYDIAVNLGCGRVAGFVAALCYALGPWWALGSQFIMAEALLPAGALALIALCVRLRSARRWWPWSVVGVGAAVLALARADMQLLSMPLAVLAFVSRSFDRTRAALAVLLAFAAVLVLWGLANLRLQGEFGLANRAQFYALWSGLGQVPNDYGYVVSDDRAVRTLAQRGIVYHTREAEAYWREEYFKAWREHPRHVLATTAYRWLLILLGVDYSDQPLRRLTSLVKFGPALLIVALVLLLKQRDAFTALIVAGPAAYALLSLGFVYVELRYVRYASLSYLFALAFVLDRAFGVRGRSKVAGLVVGVLVAVFVVSVGTYSVEELVDLYHSNRVMLTGTAAKLMLGAMLPPRGGACGPPAWTKAVRGAKVLSQDAGGALLTTNGSAAYQGLVKLEQRNAAAVAVRAHIKTSIPAALGLLHSDGGYFVDMQMIPPGSDVDATLVGSMRPASPSLVALQTGAAGVRGRIDVWGLSCSYLCLPQARSPDVGAVFSAAGLLRAYPLSFCNP
jgi:hypothetical protein